MTAAETRNPTKNIPRAIKGVYIRIVIFYILGVFVRIGHIRLFTIYKVYCRSSALSVRATTRTSHLTLGPLRHPRGSSRSNCPGSRYCPVSSMRVSLVSCIPVPHGGAFADYISAQRLHGPPDHLICTPPRARCTALPGSAKLLRYSLRYVLRYRLFLQRIFTSAPVDQPLRYSVDFAPRLHGCMFQP